MKWIRAQKPCLQILILFIILINLVASRSRRNRADKEESTNFWKEVGQRTLKEQIERKLNENKAKNVIFFLGDGMDLTTITAGRIYAGQLNGKSGEEQHIVMDKFPYTGIAKTYCVDRQVPDSACTATAYLCGVKANYLTVGVNAKVKLNDCWAEFDEANHVDSLAVWAQKANKSTGVVTTTRVTHATPAGTYAHTSNRDNECDADLERINKNPEYCRDIASQLIFGSTGRNFDVILGGGRSKFLPNGTVDKDGVAGQRIDGVDLTKKWQKKHTRGEYVTNRDELLSLNYKQTEQILGLFTASHMSYNLEADRRKEPSLKEMTTTAIELLSKNKNGYFLFVEGGRIDHAHHEARAPVALDETVEFAKAIEAAQNMTCSKETLIIVSADHSHTFSMAGYPIRGNPITGIGTDISDIDNLPYLTLSYANGPGAEPNFKPDGGRVDPRTLTIDKDYKYPGTVPLVFEGETHGGQDVIVYASGPQAHLFCGSYEQNAIPAIIAYALCIGDGETICNQLKSDRKRWKLFN